MFQMRGMFTIYSDMNKSKFKVKWVVSACQKKKKPKNGLSGLSLVEP